MTIDDRYSIHLAVWNNDMASLEKLIADAGDQLNLEVRDPRGRTPLMLAAALGHVDILRYLIKMNASVNVEDRQGFNVLHETLTLGDAQLVSEVLERRDLQRYSSRIDGVPALLRKLRDTPDFYVEMKWEFCSWVPLVARMCPSDTYKIYKSGSSVRVDTTLLGFDQNTWLRGSRSYIFRGDAEGAKFMEVDHDMRQVCVETMKVLAPGTIDRSLKSPPDVIHARMTSPMSTTYLDTDKISFDRSKAGIYGFRSDRNEIINGYDCRVFTANNVEIVTKLRTEHLSAEDKARQKEAGASSRLTPFQSLLGMVETEEKPIDDDDEPTGDDRPLSPIRNPRNRKNITAEQYFDPNYDLKGADIGIPREITTRTQRFKANLWLCDQYPLSLFEQVMPVVDLMSISSSHFAKLRDFITLTLPAGFPVKIEIPLFHLLNARITFGNIFSLEQSVPGVTAINDETATACVVDESIFEPSASYSVRGSAEVGRQWNGGVDDEDLELAMQQFLVDDSEQVTLYEALRQQPDADLQRAIQESLAEYRRLTNPSDSPPNDDNDDLPRSSSQELGSSDQASSIANGHIPGSQVETSQINRPLPPEPVIDEWANDDLELAIRLSQQEQEQLEKRQKEEEEILQQVLALSMTEK